MKSTNCSFKSHYVNVFIRNNYTFFLLSSNKPKTVTPSSHDGVVFVPDETAALFLPAIGRTGRPRGDLGLDFTTALCSIVSDNDSEMTKLPTFLYA